MAAPDSRQAERRSVIRISSAVPAMQIFRDRVGGILRDGVARACFAAARANIGSRKICGVFQYESYIAVRRVAHRYVRVAVPVARGGATVVGSPRPRTRCAACRLPRRLACRSTRSSRTSRYSEVGEDEAPSARVAVGGAQSPCMCLCTQHCARPGPGSGLARRRGVRASSRGMQAAAHGGGRGGRGRHRERRGRGLADLDARQLAAERAPEMCSRTRRIPRLGPYAGRRCRERDARARGWRVHVGYPVCALW